jgi:hypothetical protein
MPRASSVTSLPGRFAAIEKPTEVASLILTQRAKR